MTRISAAKIICIHNRLIKSQSPHRTTYFRGQLFSITWYLSFLCLSLWRIAYSSSFVFVWSKCRLLHKHFACKKCFCYVIQRQTTFSLHNNSPSQRNCKLLCHNNWAIIPDSTAIERGCETGMKWTWLLSWKHLIDVHQNLDFEMEKNCWGARMTGNRCNKTSYLNQIFSWWWCYIGTVKVVPWSNFYPLIFRCITQNSMKDQKCHLPLQISTFNLVPEIFKFEKWVKYANEKTDDVIHSM